MPELWGRASGVNRKLRELYARDGGTNRKLREMWAREGGVGRKIFSAGAYMSGTPICVLYNGATDYTDTLSGSNTYYVINGNGINVHCATNEFTFTVPGIDYMHFGCVAIGWFIPLNFGTVITPQFLGLDRNLSVNCKISYFNEDNAIFSLALTNSIDISYYQNCNSPDGLAHLQTNSISFLARQIGSGEYTTGFTFPKGSGSAANNSLSSAYLLIMLQSEGYLMSVTRYEAITIKPMSYSLSIPNGALFILGSDGTEYPVDFSF